MDLQWTRRNPRNVTHRWTACKRALGADEAALRGSQPTVRAAHTAVRSDFVRGVRHLGVESAQRCGVVELPRAAICASLAARVHAVRRRSGGGRDDAVHTGASAVRPRSEWEAKHERRIESRRGRRVYDVQRKD